MLSSPVQLLANIMLYLCAAMVGIMSYYMADRKYRTAFLEARQSLEVKLTLEEQSTQQVSTVHRYSHTCALPNEIIHCLSLSKHTRAPLRLNTLLPNYVVLCSAGLIVERRLFSTLETPPGT